MQKRHSLNDRPAINMLAGVSVAPAQKGGSSTKMAVLVDGGRQETETGKGQLNKKEADSKESASWGGGSRIRIKNPNPSRNTCLNDFYCVFLQAELFNPACFWDIFGIRF